MTDASHRETGDNQEVQIPGTSLVRGILSLFANLDRIARRKAPAMPNRRPKPATNEHRGPMPLNYDHVMSLKRTSDRFS